MSDESTCPACGCRALDYTPATFTVCRVCGSAFPPVAGRNDRLQPTLLDRAITAVLSLALALATVLFLLVVFRRLEDLMFSSAMGWTAAVFIVAAPVAGFCLGSVRAGRAWAVIWGREKPTRLHYAVLAAFLLIVALLVVFA